MKGLDEFAEVLAEALKEKKQTGSDYTATVTRVDGSTAYVQIDGSDIADTPVSIATSCKPGDMVRVRVVNGKAWITGNDTAPPENNKEIKKEVNKKMNDDLSNRRKVITIKDGLMKFLANTLVIDSDNLKLDELGNAKFSGELEAASGTFEGTLRGATYEDTSSKFTMDIGAHTESGSISPAFKIGGYINGNPNNDYLEIEITLYKLSSSSLPQLYIAATVKNSPTDQNEHGVSIGVGDLGIDFYGSWVSGGHVTRVHSSLPWGYNP
jgi:hypothetical protein